MVYILGSNFYKNITRCHITSSSEDHFSVAVAFTSVFISCLIFIFLKVTGQSLVGSLHSAFIWNIDESRMIVAFTGITNFLKSTVLQDKSWNKYFQIWAFIFHLWKFFPLLCCQLSDTFKKISRTSTLFLDSVF